MPGCGPAVGAQPGPVDCGICGAGIPGGGPAVVAQPLPADCGVGVGMGIGTTCGIGMPGGGPAAVTLPCPADCGVGVGVDIGATCGIPGPLPQGSGGAVFAGTCISAGSETDTGACWFESDIDNAASSLVTLVAFTPWGVDTGWAATD